jgi:outer membrane murein-binding lipoprotein Lpp
VSALAAAGLLLGGCVSYPTLVQIAREREDKQPTTVHRVYPRLAVETDLQAQMNKLSAPADEPTAKSQAA